MVVTHLHHVEGADGARVRLAQLPRLLQAEAGPEATVLMGDFNAEPGSAEIAHVRSARPDRRIDYIWLSAGLEASDFAATSSTASDHRGVAVTVR